MVGVSRTYTFSFKNVQLQQHVRKDLALLDIPEPQVFGLPGHGWRPPDQGWVKINMDGALNSEASTAGAGGVARFATALLGAWCKPHVGGY